jgi:hypothetical protein
VITRAVIAAVFALLALIPSEITILNIILKIALGVAAVIALISLVTAPKNGLYVYTDGKIKLCSGVFGGGTFELKDLKRIAVNFSEWETGEFSADIKFVTEDDEVFKKEFAAKFESTENHLGLSTYTLSRAQVDEYCAKMAEMNIFNVSVIDANKDIVYQYIRK